MKDPDKNGIELLLSLQLSIELMDQYKMHGLAKRYAKMFVSQIEKEISKDYDNLYNNSPEFTTNAMNLKNRLITDIAEMNEADVMLFSEFTKKFKSNIEIK